MSPSPDIDRVAKAMRSAYAAHTGEGCCSWSRAAAGPRKAWIACARAALAELRTPSAGMKSAMFDELNYGQRCCTAHQEGPVWEAGIDAALGGDQ